MANVPAENAPEPVCPKAIEGSSDAEVCSLARFAWQGICVLSLRQRRALLLHSQEMIIHILHSGISHEELAESLGLSPPEWSNVRARVPMADFEIACLSLMKNGEKRNLELATKSIKKARFEARLRLRRNLTKK